MKRNLLLSLMIIGLLGCDETDEKGSDATKLITISTAVTRVANDVFENGDRIRVYNYKSESPSIASKPIYTLTDGLWVTDQAMEWKGTESQDFLAIYPERNISDLDAEQVTLGDNLKENDILMAKTLKRSGSQGRVPLVFNHVMCKVVVNLQFSNEFPTAPEVEKMTVTTIKRAVLQLKISSMGPANSSLGQMEFTKVGLSYEAIVPAQNAIKAGEVLVTIKIKGVEKPYTYHSSINMKYDIGKITTFNFTIGRSLINLGSMTITPWTDLGEMDGEALQ